MCRWHAVSELLKHLSYRNYIKIGSKDSKGSRELLLHVADQDSISGTEYGLLSTASCYQVLHFLEQILEKALSTAKYSPRIYPFQSIEIYLFS